jgi:hypothetical protein
MMTPLLVIARRVAWLLLIAMVGAAVIAWIRGRSTPQLGAPPEWPPLEPIAPDDPGADEPAPAPTASTWVEAAADGAVPEGYPIKVNTRSGVFHVPGGRFYERTNAQRFYATADAAVADGYRQSKS